MAHLHHFIHLFLQMELFSHSRQIEGIISPSPFGEGRGEACDLFCSKVTPMKIAD
jgi:hypothetical protein